MTRGPAPKAKGSVDLSRRPAHRDVSSRALPVGESLREVDPPDTLSPAAAHVWRLCVEEMAGNRHLREVDLTHLENFCRWTQVANEAQASLNEYGALITSEVLDESGGVVAIKQSVNPAVKLLKEASVQMRQISDALGLNPLARIRAGLMEIAGQSMVVDLRERLVARVKGELPS